MENKSFQHLLIEILSTDLEVSFFVILLYFKVYEHLIHASFLYQIQLQKRRHPIHRSLLPLVLQMHYSFLSKTFSVYRLISVSDKAQNIQENIDKVKI